MRAAFAQVVPVPPEHRRWLEPEEALGVLRCTGDELQALVEAGLVNRDGCVEGHDTWNTGLYEGSERTMPEREMLVLRHMLASRGGDWVSPRRYAVTARMFCPWAPDCSPSAEWATPRLSGVNWSGHQIGAGNATWQGEVQLSGKASSVRDPGLHGAWLELLNSYRYHATPPHLARQTEATRARGVGECEALSRVLIQDLAAAGWPASLRAGLLLGGARTRRRYWVEVTDADGDVRALDPAMAILAERFFSPQYRQFCCGSLLNRVLPLARDEDFETRHDGPHGPVAVDVQITLQRLQSEAVVHVGGGDAQRNRQAVSVGDQVDLRSVLATVGRKRRLVPLHCSGTRRLSVTTCRPTGPALPSVAR
jgi:hypothetical protein